MTSFGVRVYDMLTDNYAITNNRCPKMTPFFAFSLTSKMLKLLDFYFYLNYFFNVFLELF